MASEGKLTVSQQGLPSSLTHMTFFSVLTDKGLNCACSSQAEMVNELDVLSLLLGLYKTKTNFFFEPYVF